MPDCVTFMAGHGAVGCWGLMQTCGLVRESKSNDQNATCNSSRSKFPTVAEGFLLVGRDTVRSWNICS
jgi:hypothetical protein